MRPENVIRESRTPHSRDFYLAYLNSTDWRRRRNAALQRVGWRCERCGRKRDLNVHHKTYERLGAENPEDLEVLCVDCHEGEHVKQLEESDSRVYLKIASEAFREHQFASIGDIAEHAKQLCASHKIPYSGPELHRAIGLLTGSRLQRVEPPSRPDGTTRPEFSFSRQEAHEFFCRFQMLFTGKGMPSVEKTPREQTAHEARLREQVRVAQRQPRKRQSFEERLDAIFAEKP